MTLYDTRLDQAELIAFSEEVLRLWNAHDVDGVVAHLTDDVTWSFPLHEEPLHGRAAVADDLRDTFTAFPDLQIPEEEFVMFTDADRQLTMQSWTMTGTMTGPSKAAGLPATGASVRIVGSTLCRIRNGEVSAWTTTYDALDFMQQIGLLPRSNGMGFKAVVMADVLAGKAKKALHR
ncbi:MAG TPA: ester cyclase [Marmoricola sp.]|nr:ester cyclase [Marmoricola sp.]